MTNEIPRWRQGLFSAFHLTPRAPRDTTGEPARHWSSRILHLIGQATAHSAMGLITAAAVTLWIVFGCFVDFPGWWIAVLEVVSSAVTLVMVFAIQHTQSRQQSATQRKLDELLRSLPGADNRLIAVEEAADGELEALADHNLAARERAVREAGEVTREPEAV